MDGPSNPKTDLDTHDQAGSDAEGRGGDHREQQDNGTGGRGFNVQGSNTFRGDVPLPKDPHAPPGLGADGDFFQFDQGLNEGKEVGHDGNILSYGIEGPAAGGGLDKNTKT